MRKKIFFSIGILMLCLTAYALYLYNKPHTDVDTITPAFTMNAPDLYAAYSQNEAAADAKFLDKVVLVKGNISDISRTDSTLTVLLESDNTAGGVSCNILTGNTTAAVVQKGGAISIKGKCTGFLADVMLTDCVVEK